MLTTGLCWEGCGVCRRAELPGGSVKVKKYTCCITSIGGQEGVVGGEGAFMLQISTSTGRYKKLGDIRKYTSNNFAGHC